MKVLVLGASGQLARALGTAPLPAGWRLAVVGRPRLDITDLASLRAAMAAHAPDVVINAAAYTAVDKAEEEPQAAFAVNRDGAANAARVCAERGIALIHVSTDYVFDGCKAGAWREEDAPAPLNVYGASKLAGEQAVRALCPQHVIVRTSWLYSPWGHNFVRTMLRLAHQRQQLDVIADQHGCPTYAPHLAAGLLHIAARLRRSARPMWGLCHLAGSGSASWCELATYIMQCSRLLGGPAAEVRPIATHEFPTRARRPANSRLDCMRAERLFGMRLPHWRLGVRACVERLLARRTIP